MISIIIPIYNGAQFLDESIRSVLRQDSKDWELLLIDDGSTDATPQICQKYIDHDRVRYFRKENSGVQETRWYGVQQAKAEYVMFLDADDILLPQAVGDLCRVLVNRDVIVFGMQIFTENCEIEQNFPAVSIAEIIYDKITIVRSILVGKILSRVWGAVYRRAIISDSKDIFCNTLKIGEDTMFNVEFVFSKSPSVAILPSQLYCYRSNPDSVSHTFNEKRHNAVYNTILYLESFLAKNQLSDLLRSEAGFRLLLLWSSFMFHPNNKYYNDKALRRKMRHLYFPAFKYLYPYLRVYLFIDLFIWRLHNKKRC